MIINNKNPCVSVVVAVYNVEPFIRQCINSIINQTLESIEIILVDDGSTDNSGVICDEYASIDERIRVIHKLNEGISCARNDGIEASSAPYVMFIDGDDWVEPEFCEAPYSKAVKNGADLVLFEYSKYHDDGRVINVPAKMPSEGSITKSEAMRYNVYYACNAWIGLYRRRLFDDVRFPPHAIYEDIGTGHRLVYASQNTCYIRRSLYKYRVQRLGSITNLYGPNHPDAKNMLESKIDDLCRWGYEEYARKDALALVVSYGYQDSTQKTYVDIVRRMRGRPPKDFTCKQRMLLMTFKLSPCLFDAICIMLGLRLT